MWWLPDDAREALRGDVTVDAVVSATYDGAVTEASLPVIACTYRSSYDGSSVRSSVALTVDDDEGRLTPLRPTDALAPYGQRLVVRARVGARGQQWSVPMGQFRLQEPDASGGWLYRHLPQRLHVAEGWTGVSDYRLIDGSDYAAFPYATRLPDGTIAVLYSDQKSHFTPGTPRLLISSGGTWAQQPQPDTVTNPPGSGAYTMAAGLASIGSTIYALMRPASTADPVICKQFYGGSWNATTIVRFATAVIPCSLTALGTRMIAVGYSGAGIQLSESLDAGEVWSPLATLSAYRMQDGYTEASVTACADGRLLLLIRSEKGPHLIGLWSTDGGRTWGEPWATLTGALMLPQPTLLSDGSLVMPIRETISGDVWADRSSTWAWAWSTDHGRTWQRYAPGWPGKMMYGKFLEDAPGRLTLIGSTQPQHKITTDADLWSRTIAWERRTQVDADGVWLPTGGTVSVQADDLQLSVQKSEIAGLMQPAKGASVDSEVRRLAYGLIGVRRGSIPMKAIPARGVYETDRHQVMRDLLTLVDMVPACARDGYLVPLRPTRKKSADLMVSPDAGNLISARVMPTDAGLVNVVETINDQTDSTEGAAKQIRAIVRESSGPYRAQGPLGPILRQHASPLYATQAQAQAGAQTILDRERAARELRVQAQLTYDPTVDVLDTHLLWLAPGLQVLALVVDVEMDLVQGGAMQVTYTVPRAEVESWIRPSLV